MEQATPTYYAVSKAFHSVDAPYHGLRVDIVRYTDSAYTLRMYRDNFNGFTAAQQVRLAEYLFTVMERMRNLGIQVQPEFEQKVPR